MNLFLLRDEWFCVKARNPPNNFKQIILDIIFPKMAAYNFM